MGIDGQRLGIAVMVLGLLIAAGGAFYAMGGRLPYFGQLPGDISGGSDNVRWSVPLGSTLVISIVLSVVLTVVLNLVIRR